MHRALELVARRARIEQLRMPIVQEIPAGQRELPHRANPPAEAQVELRISRDNGRRAAGERPEKSVELEAVREIQIRPDLEDVGGIVGFEHAA